MYKIQEKEFTREDFSCEKLMDNDYIHEPDDSLVTLPMHVLDVTISTMNYYRNKYLEISKQLENDMERDEMLRLQKLKKDYWWQMIQLLPSSYNQTRNVMMNYEVLANIYKSRKNHKLDEWKKICRWIKTLPCQKLITGEDVTMCDECKKQYDGCSVDCAREFEKVED